MDETTKAVGSFSEYTRERADRELLRYAVQRAITCPRCGGVLDVTRAVLMLDGDRAARIACALCYARPVGSFVAGSVRVIDGRTYVRAKGRVWRYA